MNQYTSLEVCKSRYFKKNMNQYTSLEVCNAIAKKLPRFKTDMWMRKCIGYKHWLMVDGEPRDGCLKLPALNLADCMRAIRELSEKEGWLYCELKEGIKHLTDAYIADDFTIGEKTNEYLLWIIK